MLTILTSAKDYTFREKVIPALKNIRKGLEYQKVTFDGEIYHPKKGEVCIAMGEPFVKALQKEGLVHKGRTLNFFRETAIKSEKGGYWFITHDPGALYIDPAKEPDLQWDLTLADRFERTGSTDAKLGEYKYVKSFSWMIKYIKRKYDKLGKKVTVSVDLETMGLYPWYPNKKIVTIQISVKKDHAHVAYVLDFDKEQMKKIRKQLKWILNSDKVNTVGANLKYDLVWIREKYKIKCTNFFLDTLLVGGILNENRSNSLSNHTKEYVPELGGYDSFLEKNYDKGKMEEIPKRVLLPYAGGDTDSCLQVSLKQRKKLRGTRLQHFYFKLLHPAARAFEEVEYNGLCADPHRFVEVREIIQKEVDRCEAELIDMLPRKLKLKHKDKDNLLTPAIITEYLFTPYGLNLKPKVHTKTGKISTTNDHFMMFEDNEEASRFIGLYKERGMASKAISTYIDGFLDDLRPDNKFHCTYLLYKGSMYGDDVQGGTNTGRLSVKNVAIQCLKGSMRVMTDKGYIPIEQIVTAYEQGTKFEVLTHTGRVNPVVGVYRNGIKKVFTLKFEQGKVLTCTGNHPCLTDRGWVRADELKVGDTCYGIRSSYKRLYESNLLQLGFDEESLQQQNEQGLSEIRWQRDKTLQKVAQVRELLKRYGGEAFNGLVDRPDRCERGLHAGELSMGDCSDAIGQSQKYQDDNIQGQDSNRSSLGEGIRDIAGETSLSVDRFGFTYGDSLDEGEIFERRLFEECKIISIVDDGECETYDLTIEGSHSFIAEDIIVHNTVPKHKHKNKWAPLLRSCYIAPPGYVCFQLDFSQGELRITADLADEDTMIQAYLDGIDLHALTGAGLSGHTLKQVLAFEKTNKDKFDQIRLGAKAANFGKIYGQQPKGYIDYARANYGLKLTMNESVEIDERFFNKYRKLRPWHTRYQRIAKENGCIESPLGRIRHLPLINSKIWGLASKAERQAINSPVQGTLSDMCVWSIALITQRFSKKDIWVAAMIHDSIVGYVREDRAIELMGEMKHIMENLPLKKEFGWSPKVPFPVDGELGPNLSELNKVKL